MNNYSYIKTPRAFKKCLRQLQKCHTMVVDLEGLENDHVRLLDIKTDTGCYLIDVKALGRYTLIYKPRGIAHSLADLLSSHHIVKLMYDCRKDASALYSTFRVKLNCVIDVQLALVQHIRAQGVVCKYVPGLNKAVSRNLDTETAKRFSLLSQQCKEKFATDNTVWTRECITPQMQEYSGNDLNVIHSLFSTITPRLSFKALRWVVEQSHIRCREYKTGSSHHTLAPN